MKMSKHLEWRKSHRIRLVQWEKENRGNLTTMDLGKEGRKLDALLAKSNSIVVDIGFHAFVQTDRKVKAICEREFGVKQKVDFETSKLFKYLLVIDGNTWPARYILFLTHPSLQNYLQTGSVILYNGAFIDWFSGGLVPWVHYIPVAYDYSDMMERIAWLEENDEEARRIGERAMEFMQGYVRRNEMRCYTGLAMIEYCALWE
jgi:hypothetical protein